MTPSERLAQEKIKELEGILPDMPRFEGFSKSMSQGKHPFEEKEFKDVPQKSAEDLAAEEAFDEDLMQRELQGRLLGETLSPRQFGVLYKAKMDEGSQMQFIKDTERRQFIESRDLVRILDEQKESYRRRMVASGEWTEEESGERVGAILK